MGALVQEPNDQLKNTHIPTPISDNPRFVGAASLATVACCHKIPIAVVNIAFHLPTQVKSLHVVAVGSTIGRTSSPGLYRRMVVTARWPAREMIERCSMMQTARREKIYVKYLEVKLLQEHMEAGHFVAVAVVMISTSI